ncbi:hypothetical protein P3S67_031432 [Capsicum chacoense]
MDEVVVLSPYISAFVRSALKKIRSPREFESSAEKIWCMFNLFPVYCLLMAFLCFAVPMHINVGICILLAMVWMGIQSVLFHTLGYWNTYKPY